MNDFLGSRSSVSNDRLTSNYSRTVASIETLVLLPSDRRLMRRLTSLFSDQQTALMQAPVGAWESLDQDLFDMLEWALQMDGVKELLLVSSSQVISGLQRQTQSMLEVDQTEDRDMHLRRLMDVERINHRNASIQEAFCKQVQRMVETPLIASRIQTGELNVQAMFYRSESGVFLEVDWRTGVSRPLNA